jgi:hypothetical protein
VLGARAGVMAEQHASAARRNTMSLENEAVIEHMFE